MFKPITTSIMLRSVRLHQLAEVNTMDNKNNREKGKVFIPRCSSCHNNDVVIDTGAVDSVTLLLEVKCLLGIKNVRSSKKSYCVFVIFLW